MRGDSIVKLQAILGHASVRTTQIYARLAPDHLIGATSILHRLGVAKPSQDSAPIAHGIQARAGSVGSARVSMRECAGSKAKWRRSQVVRQRTANPLFGGSNPPGASSPSAEDVPSFAKRAWRNWKTLGT
jgi:hypothetical protein